MKLWEKGKKLDKDVEAFTVGKDYVYDQRLVPFDCRVSLAHAKLLHKEKLLSAAELKKLSKELDAIVKLHAAGKFQLQPQDEDVHTKIEDHLTKKLGETGKKLHALRSRNDQVVAALRLYAKDQLQTTIKVVESTVAVFKQFATKHKSVRMPGYTHFQRAMPSTVDIWATAFIDSLNEDLAALKLAPKANDVNPLGSAAGYGLPVKIDKKLTTKVLGFSKVFSSPLYVQNGRLKTELTTVFALLQVMLTLNKFATDVILFSSTEFGFFSLPDALCTGSSLMPQKKNPDAAEMLRGHLSSVHANLVQIIALATNLPSGYHRDFQLAKGPLIESFDVVQASLRIAAKLVAGLEPNQSHLEQACSKELYAAEEALKLAYEGIPFRDAYKQVAEEWA